MLFTSLSVRLRKSRFCFQYTTIAIGATAPFGALGSRQNSLVEKELYGKTKPRQSRADRLGHKKVSSLVLEFSSQSTTPRSAPDWRQSPATLPCRRRWMAAYLRVSTSLLPGCPPAPVAYVHCLGQCHCLPTHLGMDLSPCFHVLDRAEEVDQRSIVKILQNRVLEPYLNGPFFGLIMNRSSFHNSKPMRFQVLCGLASRQNGETRLAKDRIVPELVYVGSQKEYERIAKGSRSSVLNVL